MGRARALLAFLALVVAVQAALALGGKVFLLTQLTMAGYYSLVVIGLCLLMGYAGQVSLGHAGFFAIGGYLQAVLTTANLAPDPQAGAAPLLRAAGLLVERKDLYGASLQSLAPWAALPAALLAAGLVALLIGVPVLRLRGHYLAMATLGFGLIVHRVVLATAVFGQADGLTGVPPFPLPAGLQVCGAAANRVANYYIAWALVAAAAWLTLNLVHSRVGRALRSIHGSEEAAGALGVDTARYKQLTFLWSALLAAAGGALLTHFNGGIGPSEATTMKSIRYVAIVAAGGLDNLWGALAAGVALNFLSLRGVFGTYDDVVFGGMLILIMLFAPRGLRLPARLAGLPARVGMRLRPGGRAARTSEGDHAGTTP